MCINCPVCYEDKPGISLECGHKFCKSCLRGIIKYTDIDNVNILTCPYCRAEINNISNKYIGKLLRQLYIDIQNKRFEQNGFGVYTEIIYRFIEDNNEEKIQEYPNILKFNTYQKYLS